MLLRRSSGVSALRFLGSTDETEDVFLLLLVAGSYLCTDRRRFRSLPSRLLLLDGLRRRRRGGVRLRLLLLLRVSRRSSFPEPLRPVERSVSSSSNTDGLLALRPAGFRSGLRLDARERDLDLEYDVDRRRRKSGVADRLLRLDVDLLRFRGLGEGDLEPVDRDGDLRRVPRSGVRPLPRPRPR
jgi:hypothetical protein